MQINRLPAYDASDNPTGCCPRFNPTGWDGQDLHFKDKAFVRVTTKAENHVPIDMGPVFEETFGAIEAAGALDYEDLIILSRTLSPSQSEHFFSVCKPVPGKELVRWTGTYRTKVFEGSYENEQRWENDIREAVRAHSGEAGAVYFFWTTCPKCAATYGRNYVVAVAEVLDNPMPVGSAA